MRLAGGWGRSPGCGFLPYQITQYNYLIPSSDNPEARLQIPPIGTTWTAPGTPPIYQSWIYLPRSCSRNHSRSILLAACPYSRTVCCFKAWSKWSITEVDEGPLLKWLSPPATCREKAAWRPADRRRHPCAASETSAPHDYLLKPVPGQATQLRRCRHIQHHLEVLFGLFDAAPGRRPKP